MQVYAAMAAIVAIVACIQGFWLILARGEVASLSSTFAARNEMVFFLVPGFAFALGLFLMAYRTWMNLGIVVMIFVALVLSRGRAGVFLIVLASLALLAVAWRSTRGNHVQFGRGVVVVGAISLVVVGFWAMQRDLASYFTNRYVTSVSKELTEERGSVFMRVMVIRGVWDAFQTSPVVGIGAGNFKPRSQEFVDLTVNDSDLIQPHNTYLGLLAESGLVGLLAFLGVLGSCLPTWRQLRQGVERRDWTIVTMVVALVCLLLNLATFDALARYPLWLLVGLALAARRLADLAPDDLTGGTGSRAGRAR
jgi:O-antigen ligase